MTSYLRLIFVTHTRGLIDCLTFSLNNGRLCSNLSFMFIGLSENVAAKNLNAVHSRGSDQEALVAVRQITWTDASL